MTYIIAGSSSGLGRALAQRFAQSGAELILLSRDERDTGALASDLELRYGVRVSALAFDFDAEMPDFAPLDACLVDHAPLRGLLLPVGLNADDDAVGVDAAVADTLTRVNYLTPVALVRHYLQEIEAAGGEIIGFGSVATARGRTRNATYAAAKRALESYFESLAHYAEGRSLSAQFYVLGYLDTNLAFTQDLLFPRASPERVAETVYARLGQTGKRFLPRPWYFLYRVVQLLPWVIFKRLSF
jgi:short-subunit dehydrogenase